MPLDTELLTMLRGKALCFLATTMPDGSPQVTETWVDADEAGEHVVINTVVGFQKVRNIERDRRVAVAIADPANPTRYVQVRGEVVGMTTEGGAEHIDAMSQKYTGRPYPWYGGRDQQRIILTIAPRRTHRQG